MAMQAGWFVKVSSIPSVEELAPVDTNAESEGCESTSSTVFSNTLSLISFQI